ncbi:serine protease inhibitor 77Ba-like isoform X2 [Arctopsyche grandis]|uniref:serine protease inhibitor 77Ba-like isoform X2 n=1 Tax=Arctopsyche grandis TaxID=121162 RepID=UPI00406D7227
MNTLPTGILLCAVLFLGLTIHVDSQRRPQQEMNLDILKNLSQGIEKFSLTLLLRTTLDSAYENYVICPLSVWTMLTVLTEGTKLDTHYQLSTVLRHPQNNKQILRDAYKMIEKAFIVNTPTVELAAVNSFFVDRNVRVSTEYLNLLRNEYNTQINNLNFADPNAATSINDVISQATRGKIRKIVESGDLRDSTMILTNAVYFRGQWELPFNASLTKRETFYDTAGKAIGEVNLMYQRGPFPYANMPNFKAHVVELPYGKERRLSMIVMIPYHKVSLLELLQKFTAIPMSEVLNALEEAASAYEDDEVDVYLPRFTIDTDFLLNKILFNMGIQDVFDASYADLSGITSGKLFLSKVLHKAFIEVTEEGTIATAVTAGELSDRNTPPKFTANKPFLYFIYEKTTKIIVFAGNYNKPSLY